MLLGDMFKKTTYIPIRMQQNMNQSQVEDTGSQEDDGQGETPNVPEGLWKKCKSCGEMVYAEDVKNNYYICPKCNHYFRIHARTRIRMLADENGFEEWDNDICTSNPLGFDGYEDKVQHLKEATKLDEAVITGLAVIHGCKTVIGVCDTRFLMGSMGEIVGEKITRAFERATESKLPVVIFTCSGGARMQEGIVSLMQMAKTSQAIKKHSEAGLLYITVLTDPTTGGVSASFAMLGDIILAEPGALVGFAGPRVIKQTIGQDLPDGFQRAEFLVEHGFADRIVTRENLKKTLSDLICMNQKPDYAVLGSLREKCVKYKIENNIVDAKINESDSTLTPWDRVQIARSARRPTALDYIDEIFDNFYEMHGDRQYRDDGAIVGGIAYFGDMPVTVIGQQKGKNTAENIKRNFGMPYPEGYRKALRLMKQAEKFHRPVICFVDTPGAFCGIEAEERGQGEAIARNLLEMSALQVPVLSVVIGEGGSGGALGMAVANEVWMMENSTYSILSPEGFASILWKDSKRSKEASDVMKITASDLKQLSIIERVIPEPEPADMGNMDKICFFMKRKIIKFLRKYETMEPERIREERYQRFRRF